MGGSTTYVSLIAGSSEKIRITTTLTTMSNTTDWSNTTGPSIRNEACTNLNPTLCPYKTADAYGVGGGTTYV